jgi:hypothetical protein
MKTMIMMTLAINTIPQALQQAKENGYTEDFTTTKDGLYCSSNKNVYREDQLSSVKFTPSLRSIIYLIVTKDNKKGTLIEYVEEAA